MEKRKRRSFSAAYKTEVVDLDRASGKRIGAAAKDLGLTVFSRWSGRRCEVEPVATAHVWRGRNRTPKPRTVNASIRPVAALLAQPSSPAERRLSVKNDLGKFKAMLHPYPRADACLRRCCDQ
jgi:hypothetical protein